VGDSLHRLQRPLVAALVVFLALTAADTVATLPAESILEWSYSAAELAAVALLALRIATHRSERAAWAWVMVGVLSFTLGDLYWSLVLTGQDEVPYPSWADAGYLGFYPAMYVGLMMLLRRRSGRVPRSLWLEGILGALAVSALAAALAFDTIVSGTGGAPATVATNLAYPLGDLLMLGLVVAVLVLTGWHPGRTWALVAAGLGTFAVIDTIYLYDTAIGTYVEGTPLDVGWPFGLALIAFAAWQPATRVQSDRIQAGWATIAAPLVFGGIALGVLFYDHFTRLSLVAVGLATAGILAVFGRLLLGFSEHLKLLRASTQHAVTDPLTGLGNRRALSSTASRCTTTPTATRSATRSCAVCRRASPPRPATPAARTGWVATSSASCSRAPAIRPCCRRAPRP
jgi:hypothetical protein